MTVSTILDTYDLSEILDMNDLTQEEVLEYLVEQGMIKLPDVRPLDYD